MKSREWRMAPSPTTLGSCCVVDGPSLGMEIVKVREVLPNEQTIPKELVKEMISNLKSYSIYLECQGKPCGHTHICIPCDIKNDIENTFLKLAPYLEDK